MLNRTMTLGELIAALDRKEPGESVHFDFGYFTPDSLHSWRGSYEQLALGYTNEYVSKITVKELLVMLRDARVKTFHGYKGGEYFMDDDTPVWVANYNEGCHTAIVDVESNDMGVMLRTWWVD